MRVIIVSFLLLLTAGCKNHSADAHAKTVSRLKSAMQSKLYSDINNDSSKAKYQVLDVSFFEDKDFFICEFRVRLLQAGKDTTGTMIANISKDMTTVNRKY